MMPYHHFLTKNLVGGGVKTHLIIFSYNTIEAINTYLNKAKGLIDVE